MERCFPPFRLDLDSEQLWRDDQPVALRPKTFAVLRSLVEHPGQLVTKDALLDAVWAGTVVSDTVLKSCIRELRVALDDDVQTPRFIATVHRRGYRWIAASAAPVQSSEFKVQSPLSPLVSSLKSPASPVVGRDAELTHLHNLLAKALNGERQLVFVTGEAGIGKTTLVEAFLHTLTPSTQPLPPFSWLGRGQCIEQYGAGEAYMPILEALGRLCREPEGERLIALLHQHAPTWLVQMPTVLNVAELEAVQRKVQGATRERMLREMVEAVEAITAERPLVLWLEDLHWSDPSTLELLALLARRREAARVLVIGTYRPVDVIVREHPLKAVKQELQLHGQCEELAVRLLSEKHIADYLAVRLQVPSPAKTGEGQGKKQSSTALLQDLAHSIHQRTEGNPLFMVNVVDEFLTRGQRDDLTVALNTPATIREMIEQQLERLSAEEQKVLEVASVTGVEFSAAAVAAGAETTLDEVEQQCAALARRGQFLQAKETAEWPDGTLATRYGFLHALYQEVTYGRIPAGQCSKLHRRIGERMEAVYGARATEIAAELAAHFERGRDFQRAVHYLGQAGKNALGRSAHPEVIPLITKGLALLSELPDTPKRIQQELQLLMTLGPALISLKGYGASEVENVYARAYELSRQGGSPAQLLDVLLGLFVFYQVRGEIRKAQDLAERGRQATQQVSTPTALIAVYAMLGESSFYRGEFSTACVHFERGLELYCPQEHNPHVVQTWVDPGVALLCDISGVLWLLGYPDQARQRLQEGLTLAAGLIHPFSLAYVLISGCLLHSYRQEWKLTRAQAEELIALSTEQGFPFFLAKGTARKGQALAAQGQREEGIVHMQQGLARLRVAGTEVEGVGYVSGLAIAYAEAGRIKEGLTVLGEALVLVDNTGARVQEAELYRLKGELTLQQERQKSKGKNQKAKMEPSPQPLTPSTHAEVEQEAEACFRKAITIAQHQKAKSWELRASTSLARLWQRQGKKKKAHKLLAEVYHCFTEGFDTKDLQEAKALLEELSH